MKTAQCQVRLTLTIQHANSLASACFLLASLSCGRLEVIVEMAASGLLAPQAETGRRRAGPGARVMEAVRHSILQAKHLIGYGPGDGLSIAHPQLSWASRCAMELHQVIRRGLLTAPRLSAYFDDEDFGGLRQRLTAEPAPTATVLPDSGVRLMELRLSEGQACALVAASELFTRVCLGQLEVVADLVQAGETPCRKADSPEPFKASHDATREVGRALTSAKGHLGYSAGRAMTLAHPHVRMPAVQCWEISQALRRGLGPARIAPGKQVCSTAPATRSAANPGPVVFITGGVNGGRP